MVENTYDPGELLLEDSGELLSEDSGEVLNGSNKSVETGTESETVYNHCLFQCNKLRNKLKNEKVDRTKRLENTYFYKNPLFIRD